MSLSTTNVAGILTSSRPLSASACERLRNDWAQSRPLILEQGDKFEPLDALISRAQARHFPAPAPYYAPPIPFRWGPNGSLLLLIYMLAAYAIAVWLVITVMRLA